MENVSIPPPDSEVIEYVPISFPSVTSSSDIEYSPVGAVA